MTSPGDLAGRLEATGRILVRSGTEIGRALEAVLEAGEPVSCAPGNGEVLFLARLLAVDRPARSIKVAWSESKNANAALLGQASVAFACNHAGTHYEFLCASPRSSEHRGEPAIELDFPSALVALQRRKEKRVAVPPPVPLRCDVTSGPISFEGKIVDISLNGLGALVYDPAIHLEAGMLLERCRILHPERAPVLVALQVCGTSRESSFPGAATPAGPVAG